MITTKKIDTYLHSLIPDRPPILREMEAYAEDNGFPIVGPVVGRYLYQLALQMKARRILELGSGFGYSAFWFSLAVKSKGQITMTDGDKAYKKRAFDYFKRAGLQSQFDFRVGDARRIIKKLSGPYDIILNDIDKDGYPETIDPVAERLRKGGVFVTDNVLWKGSVTEPEKKRDGTTQAVVKFTQRLYQDSRFVTTVLPLRDGISVAVRV
ncbi:O-methyltransferase [candidate division GN15 bacterium]|nr:O-methyltransferase [candidate division GN15 bacterium]